MLNRNLYAKYKFRKDLIYYLIFMLFFTVNAISFMNYDLYDNTK